MEKKQVGELVSVTFTWKIEKFSRLRSQKHYSDSFNVGDFEWQIVVYPKGSSGIPGTQDLSIYLKVADASALPSGWSRYAQFTLTVVNQVNYDKSITVDCNSIFDCLVCTCYVFRKTPSYQVLSIGFRVWHQLQ